MECLPDLRKLKKRGGGKGKRGKNRLIETKDGIRGTVCNCPEHLIDSINGRWVPLTEFYVTKNISEKTKKELIRYSYQCKFCTVRRRYIYESEDWYRMHLKFVIQRAKKRGIECVGMFELDEIIKECWVKQEGKDYYTGEAMKLGRADNKTNSDYISVDRIDNRKGYIKENIVLCTNRTNQFKGRLEIFREKYSKIEILSISKKMIDILWDNG